MDRRKFMQTSLVAVVLEIFAPIGKTRSLNAAPADTEQQIIT
jgi:hypothetical protein